MQTVQLSNTSGNIFAVMAAVKQQTGLDLKETMYVDHINTYRGMLKEIAKHVTLKLNDLVFSDETESNFIKQLQSQ